MTEPAVSIVMVSYNSARFLRDAVSSVYRQTFTDWELLLVNDGSTDDSGEIANELAKADPRRVRLLQHDGQDNRGIGASRNLAYRHARGEFVVKLDSDDVFASDTAIAEQVELMRAHPSVAMVYGPCEVWDSWRGGGDFLQSPSFHDEIVEPPRLLPKLLAHWRDEPHARMERRSAIEAIGGCEPSIRSYGEDFTLWLKLGLRYPLYASSRCWYRLRMHPESYTHAMTAQGRKQLEARQLYEWAERYLGAQGVRDRDIWRALNARLWPLRHPRLAHWRNEAMAQSRWLQCLVRVGVTRVMRLLSGKPRGRIHAIPRAIWVEPGSPDRVTTGEVEIQWSAHGVDRIDVRIGEPNGTYFVKGGVACGVQRSEKWVRDRMLFFLQDAGAADHAGRSATLDVVQVRVRIRAAR